MICKRCGSSNININNEMSVKTKRRGCLGWLIWISLSIITGGLLLIIPLLTNSKIKSRNRKVAICQNCGNRWRV